MISKFVNIIHCFKKCPYSEFFWSVFSRIRTQYGEIRSIQSECRKIRTRKTPNTYTSHAVIQLRLVFIPYLHFMISFGEILRLGIILTKKLLNVAASSFCHLKLPSQFLKEFRLHLKFPLFHKRNFCLQVYFF